MAQPRSHEDNSPLTRCRRSAKATPDGLDSDPTLSDRTVPPLGGNSYSLGLQPCTPHSAQRLTFGASKYEVSDTPRPRPHGDERPKAPPVLAPTPRHD